MSKFEGASPKDAEILTCIDNYVRESESARRDRMALNQANFDTYLQKQDWSHKLKGQSTEFLAKQAMAVEQIVSFVQQGLIDLGDWFDVEAQEGTDKKAKITSDDIEVLLSSQLEKEDFFNKVGDGLKLGLLGSLIVCKVHGRHTTRPRYVAKDALEVKDNEAKVVKKLYRSTDKVWQLAIDMIPQKDYFPDPTGKGLYEIHAMDLDLFEIKRQVKSKTNPTGIYEKSAVDQLAGEISNLEESAKRARANGQNVPENSYRKTIRVKEFWGTLLDSEGNVLHENVVCAVANERFLIRKPQKNPFWHGSSPFLTTPIIRVPDSVWHKALMDAPTAYNKAMNELFNLNLDAAMMAAHGIKQIRTDWLEDPSQISQGIPAGTTLEVSSNCPPGQKVLERVDTATMSQESLAMLNITDKEFQSSALTNDLRLGVMPSRQVKATEVVEASQSITGMLNGMAKSLEVFIGRVLDKSWMVSCQHYDDMDSPEIIRLLGANRAGIIRGMSREERFAETVGSHAFKVFGITSTLNKMKDFRRITAFLQTIAGSEVLMEEFAKEHSFGKLLTEIMKALDLEHRKFALDPEEKLAQSMGGMGEAAPAPQAPGQAPATPGAAPDRMSQIAKVESGASGAVPGTTFPGNRATGSLPPRGAAQ